MNDYEKLMKKCIFLAKKGKGNVEPNPYVGALIIDDKFNIISSGYHEKFGQNHAEVNAIQNANGNTKDKTLVVNLEPCSHFGKTPPCTDLIINSGIKRVVVGMNDPNLKVNGIKILKDAGIEVIEGVLSNECRKLNEIFIKNQQKMPFVAIKTATTLDGKIATKNGISKWITSEKSRNEVQKIRSHFCAVMTSSSTVLIDDPSLNVRKRNKKQPVQIIVDTNFKTDFNFKVYKNKKVILATCIEIKNFPKNVEIIKCPLKNNHVDLKFLLQKLYEKEIFSILVEAGQTFNGTLIKENLSDKLYHFIAPKITNDNSSFSLASAINLSDINKCVNLKIKKIKFLNPDILIEADF